MRENAGMTEPSEAPMPRGLAALWASEPVPTRGPKRAFSIEDVAAAAIAVGDAEGAAALSMARIAAQLGVTTMSLYRYVDSKEDLLAVVADVLVGAPPDLEALSGWHARLGAWARAEHARLLEHPWWHEIGLRSMPLGPNNLTWLEAGLHGFDDVAIAEATKVRLVVGLSLFVVAHVQFEQAVPDEPDDVYEQRLVELVAPQRFPTLAHALASGAWREGGDSGSFEFALERLLDGYAVLVSNEAG